MKKILITGGSGFIGSSIAIAFISQGNSVTCFDNLHRRGSEILLRSILDYGCTFVHGDIRNPEDLEKLTDQYDALIECSAEPSVLAGSDGKNARFMVNNNLIGSINCFEFARLHSIPVIFLSTSRVYPYNLINQYHFSEGETRFDFTDIGIGISNSGISKDFGINGNRSLYGATKLASELILQEYSSQFGIPCIINRCGVIAGPRQLGKVDQGVFTYWLINHYFKKSLHYIGFGGKGKQVRDLLHVDDLVDLLLKQVDMLQQFRGEVFNVGGSLSSNLSLLEATCLCQQITGNKVDVTPILQDRPNDVIWYISDNNQVEKVFQWSPKKKPQDIMTDIYIWLNQYQVELKDLFIG